jgi:hypothetical protein
VLAACAAVIVWRLLPATITQHGGAHGHGAVEAVEDVAELALAGAPPIFADTTTGPGQPVDD